MNADKPCVPTPETRALGPTSIDEGTKRLFDAVEVLRHAAWESFDRRRAFEWKLSFGLWTALAVGIAAFASGQAKLQSLEDRLVVTAAGAFVVVLHWVWSYFLTTVNRADLDKSFALEKHLRLTLGITDDTETGAEIQCIVHRMKNRPRWQKVGGHLTQVAVTCILAGAAIALVWLRT